MTNKLSNFSMGIGRPVIGRSETRFMRKFRWTIEFFWEDSSTLLDSVNSVLDRAGAAIDGIGAAGSALEQGVSAVGNIGSGNASGALFDAIGAGSAAISAYGSLNEAFNPTEPQEFGLRAHTCHVAKRPSVQIEKTQIYFLHERQHLAGLPSWEPLTLTLYDVAGEAEVARWLYQVYQFGKHGNSGPMSETQYYKARGFLVMWDGEGIPLQSWILHGCWPEQVDWGDLDYESSDVAQIEITMSIDSADLIYDRNGHGKGNLGEYNPGINFSTPASSPARERKISAPAQEDDNSIFSLIAAGAGVALAASGEFGISSIIPSGGRDGRGNPITLPTISQPDSNLPNIP